MSKIDPNDYEWMCGCVLDGSTSNKGFNIFSYKFNSGSRHGKPAFNVCGPYDDGSWTLEPPTSKDVVFETKQRLLNFMVWMNIEIPNSLVDRPPVWSDDPWGYGSHNNPEVLDEQQIDRQ